MEIRKLNTADEQEVSFVESVYTKSFPHSERRLIEKMIEIYKNNDEFYIVIVSKDDQLVGFLTYWDLDDFIFAEHFAISSEFRNGGYGRKVMELFMSDIKKPIILEVELPTTILAERRIGFYQRIGFKLWENIQYQQPPYHDGGKTIPMWLMTYGDIDLEKNLSHVRDNIYTRVYGL